MRLSEKNGYALMYHSDWLISSLVYFFCSSGSAIQDQLRRWEGEAKVSPGTIPGGGSGCSGTKAAISAAVVRLKLLLLPGLSGGGHKRPIQLLE